MRLTTAAEQSRVSGWFVKGHFLQFPLQPCTLWLNQIEVNTRTPQFLTVGLSNLVATFAPPSTLNALRPDPSPFNEAPQSRGPVLFNLVVAAALESNFKTSLPSSPNRGQEDDTRIDP